MDGLAKLGGLWQSIQAWLFPVLEDELGELDETHREFVAVCEVCRPLLNIALTARRWDGVKVDVSPRRRNGPDGMGLAGGWVGEMPDLGRHARAWRRAGRCEAKGRASARGHRR